MFSKITNKTNRVEEFSSNGYMNFANGQSGDLPGLDLSEEVPIDRNGETHSLTVGDLLSEAYEKRNRNPGILYVDRNRFTEGLKQLGEAILMAAQKSNGIYLSAPGRSGAELKYPNPISSWWVLGQLIEGPLSEAVSTGLVKGLTNANFDEAKKKKIGLVDDWMGSGDVMRNAAERLGLDVGIFVIASTKKAIEALGADSVFAAMVGGRGAGLTGSHAAMDNAGFTGYAGLDLTNVIKPYKAYVGEKEDETNNRIFPFIVEDDGTLRKL